MFKILIIGNIGSGKTTLGLQLLNVLPSAKLVSIDALRQKYADGTYTQEYFCWSKFLESCETIFDAENKVLVLEFSGAGVHKYAVRQALELTAKDLLIIYLRSTVEVCLERCKDKKWSIPGPWKDNPLESIPKIHHELENDWNTLFWKLPDTYLLPLNAVDKTESLLAQSVEMYTILQAIDKS